MRIRRQTAAALAVAVVLLALFSLGTAVPLDVVFTASPGGVLPTIEPRPSATFVPPDPPTDAGPDSETSDSSGLMTALGVVLVVGVVLLLAVLAARVGRALSRRTWRSPVIDEVAVQPTVSMRAVADIVQHARALIAVEGDARQVVARCWEALERLAADAGIPRLPQQTAGEYVVGMLGALDLPAGAAKRLAGLYEAALFSQGQLPDSAVADAVDALERLDVALRRRDLHRGAPA